MKPVSMSQSWLGTGRPESGRTASVTSSSRPNFPIASHKGRPSAGTPIGVATRANSAFMASVASCPLEFTAGAQNAPSDTGAEDPKGGPPRRRRGVAGASAVSA
jgi:hypothetical protein